MFIFFFFQMMNRLEILVFLFNYSHFQRFEIDKPCKENTELAREFYPTIV